MPRPQALLSVRTPLCAKCAPQTRRSIGQTAASTPGLELERRHVRGMVKTPMGHDQGPEDRHQVEGHTEVSSGRDRPVLSRRNANGRTLKAASAWPATGNSRRSVTAACSPTAGL